MNRAVRDEHEQKDAPGARDAFPDSETARVALEASDVGVWSWDIKSNTVHWSANVERIHDLPAGTFRGTLASFQEGVHPEDLPEVTAAIQESLATGKPYLVIYRLSPRPDRDDRWVEAVATLIRENGEAVRLTGS